jgi:hypothetical protein
VVLAVVVLELLEQAETASPSAAAAAAYMVSLRGVLTGVPLSGGVCLAEGRQFVPGPCQIALRFPKCFRRSLALIFLTWMRPDENESGADRANTATSHRATREHECGQTTWPEGATQEFWR